MLGPGSQVQVSPDEFARLVAIGTLVDRPWRSWRSTTDRAGKSFRRERPDAARDRTSANRVGGDQPDQARQIPQHAAARPAAAADQCGA